MEHSEVEVGQRQFGVAHLSPPTGVIGDARGGLIFVVALAVLEVMAMFEAHIFAPEQQQRVVAREVKRAGGRAEKERGVVEHAALTARLGRGLEPAGQAAQLVVDKPAISAKIFEAIRLARGVR